MNSDTRLGLASLSHIKTSLDRLFGKGEWPFWEPETISLELKMHMDDLLLDKIHLLQIVVRNPHLFYENIGFMLFATEVINNFVADFEHVPSPTTLELAYAIVEMEKVLQSEGQTPLYSEGFIKAVAYMLRQEGYSKPVRPFDFVPEGMLERGQTPADTANKEKAIEEYIKHMDTL